MPSLDLTGVDWNKIDPYTLHMLVETSRQVVSFSGTTEEWIQMALENDLFSQKQVGFLIRLKEDIPWSADKIPEMGVTSRMGRIIAALGTFESILALAKDELVQYVEASRPLFLSD